MKILIVMDGPSISSLLLPIEEITEEQSRRLSSAARRAGMVAVTRRPTWCDVEQIIADLEEEARELEEVA